MMKLSMRRAVSLAALAVASACSESPTAPDRPITAVTVAPGAQSLIIGQTAQLAATVTGGFGRPTVTWASSNANVASVTDSGKVSAKAAGTVTITATAGTVVGSSTITVSAGSVDRVNVCDQAFPASCNSTVSLPGTGTSVVARAFAVNTLNVDITSSCTFTWTPSAANVVSIVFIGDATRRDAVITRTNAQGDVAITVACGGRPGILTILGGVIAPVASLTVSPSAVTLAIGRTQQLTATMRDADGNLLTGRAVTWTTTDVNVATVNSLGLVTAVGAGSASITATIDGRIAAAAITVTATP
jgi:uncharacterized protein YjdB